MDLLLHNTAPGAGMAGWAAGADRQSPPIEAGCTQRAGTNVEELRETQLAARRGGTTGLRRPPRQTSTGGNAIARKRDDHQPEQRSGQNPSDSAA